jgi:hypothetical protein
MVWEIIGILLVVIVGAIFLGLRLGLVFPSVADRIFHKLDGDDDVQG